jgi:hypothetical protein
VSGQSRSTRRMRERELLAERDLDYQDEHHHEQREAA